MINNDIHTERIDADMANRLAAQFQGVPKYWAALSGVSPKAADLFGWTTWAKLPSVGSGFSLFWQETPAIILWFEHDYFNSLCLRIPQARMHWLLNPEFVWTVDKLSKLSNELATLLRRQEWPLFSLRLLGHNPTGSELFQRAGFRMMVGNVWLYRYPAEPPPVSLPRYVECELRNVKQHPLGDHDLKKYLALSRKCFFSDRFSLDLRIEPKLARQRFLTITENALTGQIANYVMTAKAGDEIEALLFFGVTQANKIRNLYPIAGLWFTALARPSARTQGLCSALFAESIRSLPEGKAGQANWTYACALDNFASLGAFKKLGFRLGAIAYDFHGWRDELRVQR